MREIIRPKYNKINSFKLKPKRRKVGNNARTNSRTCPNCLSNLNVTSEGTWECSGDNLKFWIKEFKKFKELKSQDKEIFIKHFSDPSKFLEMLQHWNETGSIDCGFSSRLFQPTNNYSVKLPDPIFVSRIERNLRRELTDKEKSGEKELWIKDDQFYTDKIEGSEKVEIPYITFPDEV